MGRPPKPSPTQGWHHTRQSEAIHPLTWTSQWAWDARICHWWNVGQLKQGLQLVFYGKCRAQLTLPPPASFQPLQISFKTLGKLDIQTYCYILQGMHENMACPLKIGSKQHSITVNISSSHNPLVIGQLVFMRECG